MKIIDLRSDTVTRPCDNMRALMAKAEVGDDVCGDDPTVRKLEKLAAEMTGKEAAVYASSGTQTNLMALLSHCQRGDEYIVGGTAHTYMYEGGGAAVLGGIQPQPIEFEEDATISLDKIRSKIKPDDIHFPRTKLLCLENTMSGKVLPLEYIKRAAELAEERKLKLHLDGARVFNASVALGIEVRDITKYFDSISVCLSKGLGAPVGSVLCGSEKLIKEARKWRKMLGGGMRQAGIIAAAGIYALENNVDRLAEDHRRAELLASELRDLNNVQVLGNRSYTNMVFVKVESSLFKNFAQNMKEKNILIYESNPLRLVLHLDISDEDICKTVQTFKDFFKKK